MAEPLALRVEKSCSELAADNKEAKKLAVRGDRSAVLIVHGMGQQRKLETLSEAARGIETFAKGAADKVARNIRVGDERMSRLEMSLQDGRQIDVYEAYWAPITEGQVTLRDVMAFMWNTARNGVTNSRKKLQRWVFDKPCELKQRGKSTLLYFALAAAVLASLVFLNSLTLILGAMRAVSTGPDWLKKPGVVEDVTTAILMLLCAGVGFAVLFLAAAGRKTAAPLKGPLLISRLGLYYFLGLCLETILVTVAMLVAIAMRGRFAAAAGVLVTGLTVVLLAGATLAALANAFRSKKGLADFGGAVACAALAVFAVLLAGNRDAAAEASIFEGIRVDAGVLSPVVAWIAARWVAIWMALALVSKQARRFLVQYVGDVAAYVCPNTLDRFDTVRDRIKECTFKVANAIYRMQDGPGSFKYANVVVVGHSLGSVVAYDILNRMLNEDAHAGGVLHVCNRTTGLVTFGSPLDKAAFLFEVNAATQHNERAALVATVQPLIADKRTLSIRWSNIHSPWDIFSGHLDYYGTGRVNNQVDHDAVRPLGAHTEYWGNPMVWRCINEYLPLGPAARAAAPALRRA